MRGLHFFLPFAALAAAGAAWLADLPVWAIGAAFFLAGPLTVLAAALAHLGEGAGRRLRRPSGEGSAPCPGEDRDAALAGPQRRGERPGRGRSK